MDTTRALEAISAHIDVSKKEFLEQLVRLCKQPSISAQDLGIPEMVDLLVREMEEAGFGARVLPGKKNPAVFAEMKGRRKETLLFYNHYDVQPPEPYAAWTTPPFEPTVRNGRLFARGANDNKGNISARLSAIRAIVDTQGELPITIKFIIDGEEEIGSPSLEAIFENNKELLNCDWIVWEDTLREGDTPVISLGSKALCYLEMKCKTASTDFHSAWAGVYPNAAWRLVSALSTMKNVEGKILIDGFYDDVRPFTGQEASLLDQQPEVDLGALRREFHLDKFVGNVSSAGFRAQYVSEPTCNIAGIIAGYTEEGAKTVIPCEASAKIDMRLVPDQDPESIYKKVCAHLERKGFDDIEVIPNWLGSKAYISPIDPHILGVLKESITRITGSDPIVEPLSSGATPMWMTGVLGKPVLGYGLGHPSNRIHAPNESLEIKAFVDQVKIIAGTILNL